MAAAETEGSVPPRITREDVLACAIQTWYPIFKSCTIRTALFPLSDDFLAYLDADGVVLPTPSGPLLEGDPRAASDSASDSPDHDSDEDHSSSGSSSASLPITHSFPELEAAMCSALASMPKGAFPKLSWSAPRDAVWATGTLNCHSPGMVFMFFFF